MTLRAPLTPEFPSLLYPLHFHQGNQTLLLTGLWHNIKRSSYPVFDSTEPIMWLSTYQPLPPPHLSHTTATTSPFPTPHATPSQLKPVVRRFIVSELDTNPIGLDWLWNWVLQASPYFSYGNQLPAWLYCGCTSYTPAIVVWLWLSMGQVSESFQQVLLHIRCDAEHGLVVEFFTLLTVVSLSVLSLVPASTPTVLRSHDMVES